MQQGIFSQSQFSVQTLLQCPYTPVCNCTHYICVHAKDPIVHVRVQWIMETLKHPACTLCWVARLCCSWLSQGNFSWEKPHWDNTVAKSIVAKSKVKKEWWVCIAPVQSLEGRVDTCEMLKHQFLEKIWATMPEIDLFSLTYSESKWVFTSQQSVLTSWTHHGPCLPVPLCTAGPHLPHRTQ